MTYYIKVLALRYIALMMINIRGSWPNSCMCQTDGTCLYDHRYLVISMYLFKCRF